MPAPTRTGTFEDGSTSKIWTKGRFSLRIRLRHASDVVELNEFIDGESTRRVEGSLELVTGIAQRWFQSVQWDGEL